MEYLLIPLVPSFFVVLHALMKLQQENKKLRECVDFTYQYCLCERKTYGFDYHEEHPRRGNIFGRIKTPKQFIEDYIGFEWRYSSESGMGDSKKVLTHNLGKDQWYK